MLEGSAPGFLYGQNVFGSRSPFSAARKLLMRACKRLDLPVPEATGSQWRAGDFELHRVDLAINLKLDDDIAVQNVLRQVARQLIEQDCQTWVMRTSVYWAPKKAKRYGITFYAKGLELARKKRRIATDDIFRRLAENCSGALRIELRLRHSELVQLGLNRACAWERDSAEKVFNKYFDRLPLLNVLSNHSYTEAWSRLTRPERRQVLAAASNVPLDQLYAPGSVPKVKSALRKKGIDLRIPYRPEPALSLPDLLGDPKRLMHTPQWLIDAKRAPLPRRQIAGISNATDAALG